ncbi:Tubulin beta [Fusarium oxysporum f. sp. albedinis]|nr:Tubulin beta [Fusarium oxysporum f. sp. albedinis]
MTLDQFTLENTVEPISWDRRIVSDVHNGLEGRKNTLVQHSPPAQAAPAPTYIWVSNNDKTKQNFVKPKPAQADKDCTHIPCQGISFAMIGSGSIGKQSLWLVTGTLRPGDAGLRSGDSVNETRRDNSGFDNLLMPVEDDMSRIDDLSTRHTAS